MLQRLSPAEQICREEDAGGVGAAAAVVAGSGRALHVGLPRPRRRRRAQGRRNLPTQIHMGMNWGQSLFRHHTNVAQFLLTDRQTELEEKKSAISSCYQKFLLLCILEHCENFLLFFIIFFLVTCLFMWNRPEPWVPPSLLPPFFSCSVFVRRRLI